MYEWCQDWYGPYSGEAQTDPRGPQSGSRRVIRGGCHLLPATVTQSAHRYYDSETARMYSGFRLVRRAD